MGDHANTGKLVADIDSPGFEMFTQRLDLVCRRLDEHHVGVLARLQDFDVGDALGEFARPAVTLSSLPENCSI